MPRHLAMVAILLLCYLACAPCAVAQDLATGESYQPPFLRMVVGLVLCVFLAYAVVRVLKGVQQRQVSSTSFSNLMNLNKTGVSKQVSVLETHRLNATSDVSLIAYNGKEYLVVLNPAGVTVLNEMPAKSHMNGSQS